MQEPNPQLIHIYFENKIIPSIPAQSLVNCTNPTNARQLKLTEN